MPRRQPSRKRDARASCGGIGHSSNPRPINQSGRFLGFGLIAAPSMGTIRAINPHRRRIARWIAPSNQSDQSFLGFSGRAKSVARIGRGIVGGIPTGPMNATNGGPRVETEPDGPARSSTAKSSLHVEGFGRAEIAKNPNRDANPRRRLTACVAA